MPGSLFLQPFAHPQAMHIQTGHMPTLRIDVSLDGSVQACSRHALSVGSSGKLNGSSSLPVHSAHRDQSTPHLTAVYRITGRPCSSTVLQPDHTPAASLPFALGSRAMGSCFQCARSSVEAWPQQHAQSHSLVPTTCW